MAREVPEFLGGVWSELRNGPLQGNLTQIGELCPGQHSSSTKRVERDDHVAALTNSGITISELRIRNFRSLRTVDVTLDRITVLIGENNAGKTSLLEALSIVLGPRKPILTPSDIFREPGEQIAPKDRPVVIDVLILPTDAEGKQLARFPDGSPWVDHWGNAVSHSEDDETEFVAIRTRLRWDAGQDDFVVERLFLRDWPLDPADSQTARAKEQPPAVYGHHVEAIALQYMDTKRDIRDQLHDRSSIWYELINSPSFEEGKVEVLELALAELNGQIVAGSPALRHVQEHLSDLYRTVAGTRGSVSISPLARSLTTLGSGLDLAFATQGAQAFSIAEHGMGTRSLATILTFRAYSTWRQRNAKSPTHPILALEEPESHLHPQAQRALLGQVEPIPGQTILSTHSPYVVAQSPISSYRYLRKNNGQTSVSLFDPASVEAEDLRKIERMVLNTRGEVLYAKAVVLFEGETEEQVLPVFAEGFWRRHPNEMGITFVGVGGSGNYLPFVRLFQTFEIPWFIFSDGEASARKDVQAALTALRLGELDAQANVIVLPAPMNFEMYLLSEGYVDAISAALNSYHAVDNYLDDDYIPMMRTKKAKKGVARDYNGSDGRRRAALDALSEGKTRYGVSVARQILSLADETQRLPQKVRSLFDRMSAGLKLD